MAQDDLRCASSAAALQLFISSCHVGIFSEFAIAT
jgi:hypothetical protein